MRFSIRDLMFVTALVAVYGVGLSLLTPLLRLGWAMVFGSFFFGLTLSAVVLKILFLSRRRERLGDQLLVFWNRRWWAPQAGLAGLFLLYAFVVLRTPDLVVSVPVVMGVFLAHHAMFLRFNRVAFCEHGIALGQLTLSWDDRDFLYDEAAQTLHWTHRPMVAPELSLTLGFNRLKIPDHAVARVREILAAKQNPTEEAPPASPDRQGGERG